MPKHPKRPRDPAQLAKLIVDIATGEAQDTQDSDKGPMSGERAAYWVVVRERPSYRQNSAQPLREMLPPHDGERVTTEIAIMNRQAIALAADSAVTIGRQCVWKNANKLFSLAPFNDIAIMANGSGEFVGFPWETIIKSYRLKIRRRVFPTVDACAKDFISFLRVRPASS
jgi:hypothetical protein